MKILTLPQQSNQMIPQGNELSPAGTAQETQTHSSGDLKYRGTVLSGHSFSALGSAGALNFGRHRADSQSVILIRHIRNQAHSQDAFKLLEEDRQLIDGVRVTVVVRWTPVLSTRCGTRAARPLILRPEGAPTRSMVDNSAIRPKWRRPVDGGWMMGWHGYGVAACGRCGWRGPSAGGWVRVAAVARPGLGLPGAWQQLTAAEQVTATGQFRTMLIQAAGPAGAECVRRSGSTARATFGCPGRVEVPVDPTAHDMTFSSDLGGGVWTR
jgi:hypothetical protein